MGLELLRNVHLTQIILGDAEPLDGLVTGLPIQVLPLGDIETMDGRRIRCTRADAVALLADFAARKNDLAVLYEHGEDATKGMEAAGWIGGFELRDDGIWATSVRWTTEAYASIRAGKRRYISPSVVCSVDNDGYKRPRRFVEVTVTNTPAIDGMMPLAASVRKEITMDEETTKAEGAGEIFGLKAEFAQLRAALDAQKAELEASRKATRVNELIETYKDRILPTQREHYEQLGLLSPEKLEKLLKEIPSTDRAAPRITMVRDRSDAGAAGDGRDSYLEKINRACRFAARFGTTVATAAEQLSDAGWPEVEAESFGTIRQPQLQGQDEVKEYQQRLRWIGKQRTAGIKLPPETFAAITNYQPASRAIIGSNVGYLQAEFIGTTLAPEMIAAPDGNEQGSYPVLGKQSMEVVDDDLVGVSGEVKEADRGVSWTAVTLDMRGRKVYIDARELRAGGAVNLNVTAQKLDMARGKVSLNKEIKIAAIFGTGGGGSYASASHYETLSGTAQWSHASSAPITAITNKDEFLRGLHGRRPEYLWLSPTAYTKLRFHASITALTQYGGTPQRPGGPVTMDVIAAIFNKNVVVGEAVKATAFGGSLSDVWADSAGLAYVNSSALFAPRFAMTATAAGFPKTMQFRNEERGGEGSDGHKYLEMYKAVCTLDTAGYLWLDVTA